jgi:hypothetical protein
MITNPRHVVYLACLFATSFAAPSHAASISAGMHFLAPNMLGQQVQILVSGGQPVSGIDFFVQVGDGGAAGGGDDTAPIITSVDLLTGTIFASNNTGVFTDPTPLLWGATTTTSSGTVAADGLLATLTIDTTGILAGQYGLILDPSSTGPTAFADSGVATMLINGSLQIGAAPSVPGDYNANATVDAADYVLWRDTLDQSGANLAADGNGDGSIGPADYDIWRANFNQMAGASAATDSSKSTSVPEPASLVLVLLGGLASFQRGRSGTRPSGLTLVRLAIVAAPRRLARLH